MMFSSVVSLLISLVVQSTDYTTTKLVVPFTLLPILLYNLVIHSRYEYVGEHTVLCKICKIRLT